MKTRPYCGPRLLLWASLSITALLVAQPASACPAGQEYQSGCNDPDVVQARALMEFGPHSLTGRPGATRYSLPQTDVKGKKKKPKSRTERVYAGNELVYLLPWSDKVAAAFAKGNGSIALTRQFLLTESGAAQRYNARTFTRNDGSFLFRGLKPGRYMLLTEVPYQAAVTIKEDTGRTRTETTTQGFPVFQGGQQIGFVPTSSTSVTSPIYRYDKAISDLKHYIVKVVEVRSDTPVTNLGEIE
ncbi:MAG: hypothetical protein HC788_03575 [Sphingopyxis sp.]|nr:hypothetical protein [Sphingopyxis sp.]